MRLKDTIKTILDNLPYIRLLKQKVEFYEKELFVLPGHFYSPIVNQEELIGASLKIFNQERILDGIDLNTEEQVALLNIFKEYYDAMPFTNEPLGKNRYYFNNDQYSYSDVIFLFSIMSYFKPKKIIEVGSGFSSAAMLDTNEQFFDSSIDLTFIEPFPERLKKIVRPGDKFTLIEKKVQDVDLNLFKSLQENDVLFIDSTHIAKTNSDVLFELFEILPYLNKGVKIHIHDIFYPFEYPKEWVIDQKRNWNEVYFLRTFLMYNTHFKILAFNTYLEHKYTSWFEQNMPLCLKDRGGSLWLYKMS